MLRLNGEITIGDSVLTAVHNLELEQSWETFTDTGRIIIPKVLRRGEETITVGESGIFKVGQSVTVKLGYFPTLETRFEGYVTGVIPTSPAEITIQDAAFLLKQVNVQLSFESATLKELIDEGLKQAADQTEDADRKAAIQAIEVVTIDDDMKIGSFRTVGGPVNFLGILKKIRTTYGLTSFFQGNKLFVGSPYELTKRDNKTHEIIFERNVIENNLIYWEENDIKIKIKAVSMQPDNTKIETEVGDAGGEQRTFFTYNVDNIDDLKKQAEAEIERYKYTGYRGDFLTFGEPFIKHGDSVKFVDKKHAENDNFYLIDKVITSYGVDGFRQSVKVGPQTVESALTPNTEKANELLTVAN